VSSRLETVFRFRARTDELAARALFRRRLTLDGPQGPTVSVEGRSLLNFSSNDYLGLAADPRVIEALKLGADRYGAGAGASAMVSGHLRPHRELEEQIADFTSRERALLFCSGYMANLALGLSGLLERGELMARFGRAAAALPALRQQRRRTPAPGGGREIIIDDRWCIQHGRGSGAVTGFGNGSHWHRLHAGGG
jgi:Aminotransferase class I and II